MKKLNFKSLTLLNLLLLLFNSFIEGKISKQFELEKQDNIKDQNESHSIKINSNKEKNNKKYNEKQNNQEDYDAIVQFIQEQESKDENANFATRGISLKQIDKNQTEINNSNKNKKELTLPTPILKNTRNNFINNTEDLSSQMNQTSIDYAPSMNRNGSSYIRFLGWPYAITSQNAPLVLEGKLGNTLPPTLLHATEGAKDSGTQILYGKFPKEIIKGDKVPLVSVVLLDDNRSNNEKVVNVLFENGFDMMNQKCSCYWIDANELKVKAKLTTSDKYFLQFVDTTNNPPTFNARSGYFSIIL